MLPAADVTQEHFMSHNALGLPNLGNHDPCRWAACSFFTNIETIQLKRKTFKKLRKNTHAALLTITEGAGSWLCENSHISLWIADTYDPVAAVQAIEPLDVEGV